MPHVDEHWPVHNLDSLEALADWLQARAVEAEELGGSARVAIERARGRLSPGGSFVVESIIGTRFVGRIARELRWEGYDAVVPEIEGSAWITGRNEILIAPDDPLAEGFILR